MRFEHRWPPVERDDAFETVTLDEELERLDRTVGFIRRIDVCDEFLDHSVESSSNGNSHARPDPLGASQWVSTDVRVERVAGGLHPSLARRRVAFVPCEAGIEHRCDVVDRGGVAQTVECVGEEPDVAQEFFDCG